VNAPNATAITAIQLGLASESEAGLLEKILRADVVVDHTTVPWQLVFRESGTVTEIFRKDLYQVSGSDVTAETDIIGQRIDPNT